MPYYKLAMCAVCNQTFTSHRQGHILCGEASCKSKWARRKKKNEYWYRELREPYFSRIRNNYAMKVQLDHIGIMYGHVAVEQFLEQLDIHTRAVTRELERIKQAVSDATK